MMSIRIFSTMLFLGNKKENSFMNDTVSYFMLFCFYKAIHDYTIHYWNVNDCLITRISGKSVELDILVLGFTHGKASALSAGS